jgi:hypothetical protein
MRLEVLGKLKNSSDLTEIRNCDLQAFSIELVNKGLEKIWKEPAWSNIGHYPGICLEELRRKMEILSQNGGSQGGVMKPIPSKYEETFLPID